MYLRLKVLRGKSQGREVSITGPDFKIGRAKDCDLRPKSDVISRHHCEFTFHEDGVKLRDLGSRNGTFVNGDRVGDESGRLLETGDHLKIGKLEFEVLIDHSLSGPKRRW